MFWWIIICIGILIYAIKTLYDARSEREAIKQDKLRFSEEINIKQQELSTQKYALESEYSKKRAEFAKYSAESQHALDERERQLTEKERGIVSNSKALIADAINKAVGNAKISIANREAAVATKERSLAEQEAAIKALKHVTQQLDRDTKFLVASKWKEVDEQEQLLREQKDALSSNLTALPYMAGIIADFDTRGLEILARKLDWGFNQEREKKVASIRALRKETQKLLAQSKEAEYQLAYAIKMFPALEDFLETDYSQLPDVDFLSISSELHDAARSYLSTEEYNNLSSVERNQLALDRYLTSHRRTNWQIGRDYENYVGHVYTSRGYTVEYYGSLHGLEDLGRDLIATHPDRPTLIIQCKYWSSKKTIHEKHINQLYGTLVCYCFENGLSQDEAKGILVTNISVSETARRFAKYLGIEVVEQFPLKQYPCIKCNINTDEYGKKTKIYHLPFDQQYDACKIDKPGEFFATSVAEAEAAGFRRAFKWYKND